MSPKTPPVAPPSVRLIHRVRDFIHGNLALSSLLVVGLMAIFVLLTGFYTVDNGETATLLRFGSLHRENIEPGLRFSWPGMIDEVVKARTGEISRLEILSDEDSPLSLLTSDENLIGASLVVQYRIGTLRDYLFASEDTDELLRQVVTATLVEALAATPVDEVLTSAKTAVQTRVRNRSQKRLDACNSGLTLVAVNLQAVDPPREAEGAFRGVSDARAQAAQAINKAQGERDRVLRISRGEADRELNAAAATSDNRRRQAEGSAERFLALLKQHRAAPELTRLELYNQIIQQVLPAARLVILAPGEPLQLQLNYLGEAGEGAAPVRIQPGRSMDDR